MGGVYINGYSVQCPCSTCSDNIILVRVTGHECEKFSVIIVGMDFWKTGAVGAAEPQRTAETQRLFAEDNVDPFK